MIKRLLISIALLTALLPAAAPAANAGPCTILVLGDSLSAAFGMSTHEGWVSRLEERVHAQGFACRVINASVSGDTTQGGRTRLPMLLERHRPTILILALGANDGLRALPVAQMRENLSQMIATAHGAGSAVLLIGMQMPPNYGPHYTESFAAAYQETATRLRVPFVPFLLDNVIQHAAMMQSDGMHPNENGQAQMLKNVWPGLLPLLPQQAAEPSD